jgi:hypothetical protein
MGVERTPTGTSAIDVLDHVIDKGIVIDAWVNVSVVGIDLITVEARVVVASFETYLRHSEALSRALSFRETLASRPGSPNRQAEGEIAAPVAPDRKQMKQIRHARHDRT